jgi:hypothetical protein
MSRGVLKALDAELSSLGHRHLKATGPLRDLLTQRRASLTEARATVERMAEALEALAVRCDGPEGVQPDGSNMDTSHAHGILRAFKGESE